ncbi:MAG TPA: hypothetical protein DCZ95_06045 [Verrucomicrobia bacterium]|nr:MAG: hypothetical protein A2X46_03845 [Lentisphaerae bacterium GWF2_57_35]HBA83639.1 hypothetical protein [Verrucomicrobiota bacterium]
MRTAVLRPVVLILAVLCLSGCFNQKVNVIVQPDGSGHILLTETFSRDLVDMVENSIKQVKMHFSDAGMSQENVGKTDPFHNESFLKARAQCFGPGVTFVKAQKVDQGGARGAVTLYSFQDIRQVQIPMADKSAVMAINASQMDDPEAAMDMMMEEEDPSKTVAFTFAPGEINTLTIHMPQLIADAVEMAKQNQEPASSDETATDIIVDESEAEDEENADLGLEMPGAPSPISGPAPTPGLGSGGANEEEAIQRMAKELRIQLSVEIKGQVLASTAAYPVPDKAQRFVLYDLEFGKIMTGGQGREIFSGNGDEEDVLAMFINQPGAQIETNREIRIDFK